MVARVEIERKKGRGGVTSAPRDCIFTHSFLSWFPPNDSFSNFLSAHAGPCADNLVESVRIGVEAPFPELPCQPVAPCAGCVREGVYDALVVGRKLEVRVVLA